jgi:hypothetical protein
VKTRQRGATFGAAWSYQRLRYLEWLVMREVRRHPDVVHVAAFEGNRYVAYVG